VPQRNASPARARRPSSEPGGRRQPPGAAAEVPSVLQLGSALGNRSTATLLAGGLLQRKLAIGPAGDPLEREAERAADRVVAAAATPAGSGGGPSTRPVAPVSGAATAAVQRECAACAGGGGRCAECEEKDEELRRASAAGQTGAAGADPARVESRFAALGPGRPLSPGLRGFFEPRFGHDFGAVRLHTGPSAAAAATAARARAFTLRRDVVFGAGEYAPTSRRGRHLIAHELAHVVQQAPAAGGAPVVRRQPAAAAGAAASEPAASEPPVPATASRPAPAPATEETAAAPTAPAPAERQDRARDAEAPRGLIVADEVEPEPGQMTRSAFLDELQGAACAASEEGLAGTDRNAQGCPWIDHYFRLYRGLSAERIEADLRRHVPSARAAGSARDYIAPAADHIRASVRHWARTGELTGVPQGLPGMGLLGAIGGSLAGLGRLLFQARSGGATVAAHPAAVAARLGAGRPLPGGVRSRMEGALGAGLGGVRLHTDTTAARLAGRHNARAFAVGRHVAFGAGEYRPGTLVGDALLAHELAHTVQQSGGGRGAGTESDRPLEADADRAAAGAVAVLRLGGRAAGRRPRRRAGLRLSRCSASESDFSNRQLSDYLAELRRSRSPAGGDGDVKARAVIQRHLQGDADFRIVDVPTRVLLIEELLRGWTDSDDEQAILSLLRDSPTSELQRILEAVGAARLRDNFQGAESDQLDSLLRDHQFEADVESMGGWDADGVMRILHRHGDERAIRTLLDQGYKVLRFTEAWDQWREADGTIHWEETPVAGNTCRVVKMGCPQAKVIRIHANLTSERAATTLFHEAEHAAQPEPTSRPEFLTHEVDARVAEEEFRIRHGIPPKKPSYRNPDGTVNRTAIEADITGSPHYNPTTRVRVGRRYDGEVEVTGWRLP